MIFGWECGDADGRGKLLGVSCAGATRRKEIRAQHTVVATGRGADWLEKICAEHGIAHQPGTVDIGVRVECRNRSWRKSTVLLREQADRYPRPFKNKVRTFCQNPGGFVSQENYDNDLPSSTATATRISRATTPTSPCCAATISPSRSISRLPTRQKVGELTNMLANPPSSCSASAISSTASARGKRGRAGNVRPTPAGRGRGGDITAAMPYRAMTNIINFIQAADIVVPGFAASETLLYSPELKFYSNRVKMDEKLNTKRARPALPR